MNSYKEHILDYINGKISVEDEQKLFAAMSNDDELRSGFNSFIKIDKTLKLTANSFVPSNNVTNSIFALLGFKIPADDSLIAAKESKPFFKSRLFTGLLTGILSTGLTILIMLLIFSILEKANIKKDKGLPAITRSISNKPANVMISKPKLKQLVQNVRYQNSRKSEEITNSIMKPIQANNIDSSDKLSLSSIAVDRHNTVKISTENENRSLKNPFNIENKDLKSSGIVIDDIEPHSTRNLSFMIDLRATTDVDLPRNVTTTSNSSILHNFGVTFLYNLSKYFSVGIDVKPENYVVKVTDYSTIHQNIMSYGLSLKIRNDGNSLSPIGQFTLSMNDYKGLIVRFMSGLQYPISKNLNLFGSVEFNDLFYNFSKKLYDSKKLSLNIGFSYNLNF